MKKIIITAFAFLLLSAAAMAQDGQGGRQRQKFNPTEMYEKMAERLAKQMKLDDDKTESFKVLYLDYQTARRNAIDPKGENSEDDEKVNLNKITDEDATKLIQKSFDKQEAQLKVDKDYLPRFLEILTPAQAARVYVKGAGMGRGNGQQGGMRSGGFPGGGPGGFPGGGPGGF